MALDVCWTYIMRPASGNVLELGLPKSIVVIYMVGELLLRYFLAFQLFSQISYWSV